MSVWPKNDTKFKIRFNEMDSNFKATDFIDTL